MTFMKVFASLFTKREWVSGQRPERMTWHSGAAGFIIDDEGAQFALFSMQQQPEKERFHATRQTERGYQADNGHQVSY
jgi:hypothetical protein